MGSTMLLLLLALVAVSCTSTTEPDNTPQGQAPVSPQNVTATFQSNLTSAIVAWDAPADTGLTGYHIRWKGVVRNDSGSTDVGASQSSVVITGLTGDQDYTVSLFSVRGQLRSTAATVLLAQGQTGSIASPTGLVVTPLNETTIAAKWEPSTAPGVTGYRVSYRQDSTGHEGSVTTLNTSITITNLQPGPRYSISVRAMRGSSLSDSVMVWSATAMRFSTEPGTSIPIRMYELMSVNGSGLILDPSKGGPKNASVAQSSPSISSVQLAIYVDDQSGIVDIGPAYAFPEFPAVDKFDSTVHISDSTYLATVETMNEWYYNTSIENEIIDPDGNLYAFSLPQTVTDNNGHGFFVRTGMAGNYHYARVFVKNNNGKLLQGTRPNRYVELEISYQTAANVPYAKTGGALRLPTGVTSYRRR